MSKEFYGKINQVISKILRSSLLKTTGIYVFANFANGAIPFFLLPVLTRYLTPADYGITATFGVLLAICAPFISLNIPIAISVKYFKIPQNELPQYVSNCLLLTIFSCLLITIFFIIFSSQIAKLSVFPQNWLWTVIIACFGSSIISILLMLLRVANRVYTYVTVQFFQVALNMGVSVWFVVWLNMNWQGRLAANVIAVVFFTAISIVVLYKNGWLVFKYNFAHIKDAVKFGIPLMTINIFGFVISSLDRLIIAQLIGLPAVGIYSVGVSFGQVIGAVINSINTAYSPWLFNKLKTATGQVKSKIVLISYMYVIALLIFAIIAFCLTPFIIKIFVGEKFHGALQVIFWIFLAQAFFGIDVTIANFIIYAERTKFFFAVDIFTSLFHMVFCCFMVKENGIIGAAQALATTRLIRFLMIWMISNKAYPMPWLSFYKELLTKPTNSN